MSVNIIYGFCDAIDNIIDISVISFSIAIPKKGNWFPLIDQFCKFMDG